MLVVIFLVAPVVQSEETKKSQLDRPVKIGILADRTGGLAAYGYAHVRVAEALVNKLNSGDAIGGESIQLGIAGQPIQLVIADTETSANVATLKARRMIETDKVDFLMGSNNAAISLAVAPIVREHKIVYLPTAGGAVMTAPGKSNRYFFELNTDVVQETKAAASLAIGDLGINDWVTVVVDYVWGWDQEQSFKKHAEAAGAKVLDSVRVPVGTGNWMRYLQGHIPKTAKGVYFANFGTDFLTFIRDLYMLRPDITRIGANYVMSGHDIEKLGEAAEGLYVVTAYPQESEEIGTKSDEIYRQVIGMDERGLEVGTGKHLVPSYQWSTWEGIWMIKEVVEEIGWSGKADHPEFIRALEGRRFRESFRHPEGDKYFRPEDHLDIKGLFIEQVTKGRLAVVKRVRAEELTYTPVVNFPKEEPLK
jgi:branched-chain amino acid transport system substrate-binding protein